MTGETDPRFAHFDESTALALGLALVELAQADSLPVVINIRSATRCYFHAALPGSTPLNDDWARRKSNTVLKYHQSSLAVGQAKAVKGADVTSDGLSPAEYATHGGAVPIRLTNGLMVAVATVSGLPQLEDHALVLRGIAKVLGSAG
ncbi:hypothetical protein EGN72_08235 [Pseudorhodobacter sp. E13]|uniref:heme-degrading domain-containing protein n=1 Tax=Pseudorhodobacter sp. E13 TaxID=2487931 RepID=UPI000F8DED98|nr:heme-binding protein [Pseudorhodobacter sp. E13]RUS60561.1 hypothetical protein EGN72_08235 [Pseudorhodobacter sp. E13]